MILERARDERAFLLRLAQNTARDRFRRKDTRAQYEARWARESGSIFLVTENRDEQVCAEAVAGARAELPDEQRAVVHLKLWEGLTFEVIASVLGIRLNTAASRYRYALDKLRARLRPLHQELE